MSLDTENEDENYHFHENNVKPTFLDSQTDGSSLEFRPESHLNRAGAESGGTSSEWNLDFTDAGASFNNRNNEAGQTLMNHNNDDDSDSNNELIDAHLANSLIPPEPKIRIQSLQVTINEPDILIRFSSYTRALRVLAYVFRFYHKTHAGHKDNYHFEISDVSYAELKFVKK